VRIKQQIAAILYPTVFRLKTAGMTGCRQPVLLQVLRTDAKDTVCSKPFRKLIPQPENQPARTGPLLSVGPHPEAGGPCGDVRLHDLRHSYASNLVNGGVSLYVVQQLLGHSSPAMTQRYSHLEQGTLAQASEIAAQTVMRALAG
jgi:hypothetical protein